MKVLVIIPAYNEEASILNTVHSLQAAAPWVDYVIINDGSSDATAKICQENGLNYISLPVNLGIGGAVQTGHKYALKHGYDVDIQFDGDGQHDGAYIADLVAAIEAGADLAIGSRFIQHEGFQSSGMRRVGITILSNLIKILTGRTVTDPTSGFRACGRKTIELFVRQYPQDYPEPESIVEVCRHGAKITEIPVVMKERQGGVSSISPLKGAYYMIKVSLAMIITATPNPFVKKKEF